MNSPLLLQIRLRWRLILNNRKLTAVILVLPLLLSVGIGMIFRDYSAVDKIPVAVIDLDKTEKSTALIEALGNLDSIEVKLVPPADAMRLLGDNRVEAIFTVQPGYEAMILSGALQQSIELTYLENNMVATALGDIVAREVIGEFAVYSAGNKARRLLDSEQASETAMGRTKQFIEDDIFELAIQSSLQLPENKPSPETSIGISQETSNDISNETSNETSNEISNETSTDLSAQAVLRNRIVIGMTLASTSFFMIFIGSSTIEERRQAAFQRLKCAGQPRLTGAFGGFFTFGVCLLFLQFTALTMTLGLFETAQLPKVFFTVTAFTSALCGIMLLSGTFFERSSVFQSMAAPGVFFVCLAGGAFWSLELIPAQMKWLSQATPVYWAMEALMALTYESGLPLAGLFILLISGPVFSLVAERRV